MLCRQMQAWGVRIVPAALSIVCAYKPKGVSPVMAFAQNSSSHTQLAKWKQDWSVLSLANNVQQHYQKKVK